MPDILIRGMEMPTEGGAIGIYKISGNFYAARVGKDELFPIVELPEHGDLIDRDALPLGRVEWEDIDNATVIVPASEEAANDPKT